MKDLIRKLLREFKNTPEIEIRVIGTSFPITINEAIKNYVPKNIVKEVDEFISSYSPFQGEFIDKRTNKKKVFTFTIEATDHYINRLFRTLDPEYAEGGKLNDPKIINPDTFEGLYMLIDNADKLAEQLSIGRIKDDFVVELSSKKYPKYSMIVKFDEKYPGKYILHLLTQIKGVNFFDKREQFKLLLPTYR
jgi:hypothetical protein